MSGKHIGSRRLRAPDHGRNTTRRLAAEQLESRVLFVVGGPAVTAFPLEPGLPAPNGMDIQGVVRLNVGGSAHCTGSLLADGRHILTAEHCLRTKTITGEVADTLRPSLNVQFDLYDPVTGSKAVQIPVSSADMVIQTDAANNPLWDRNYQRSVNGADLALIRLPLIAPLNATRYEINTQPNELQQEFAFIGYGRTGTGTTGDIQPMDNNKRYGENRFEALGDDFLNGTAVGLSPNTLLYDFDSGLAKNDYFGTYHAQRDLGVGIYEAMQGGGDSGGPAFQNGRIVGVSSYTTNSVGNIADAVPPTLNAAGMMISENAKTYGEIGAFVRVSSFAPWIQQVLSQPYDLTIDTTVLGMGDDGIEDVFDVDIFGDQLMIKINGNLVKSESLSKLTSLTLIGSTDRDNVRFFGLPDLNTTVATGGGDDVLYTNGIGIPPSFFSGPVFRFDGGDREDVINADDASLDIPVGVSAVSPPTYVMLEGSLGRILPTTDGIMLSEQRFANCESFEVRLSERDNQFILSSSPVGSNVTVLGGAASDTFFIGDHPLTIDDNQGLSKVHSVSVFGGAGNDVLSIDDRSNPIREQNYTISGSTISRGTDTSIALGDEDLESVTLLTAVGQSLVNFHSSPLAVSIDVQTGDANDTLRLFNFDPTGWFQGNLSFDAGQGNDRIEISDQLSRNRQWYAIGDDEITRYGDTFAIPTRTFESIQVTGSAQGSSFAVSNTRAGTETALFGSQIDDYLYVYDDQLSLSGIQGAISFIGRGGGDIAELRDDANEEAHEYHIGMSLVQRDDLAPITHDVEVLTLNTGSGDENFLIGDELAAATMLPLIFLDAGLGSDTLDYSRHTLSVSVDLLVGVGTGIASVSGIEHVLGGSGDDWLYGDGANNILRGSGGNDVLDGRGGRDFIIGGFGADVLLGGAEEDVLIGGALTYDESGHDVALRLLLAEWSRSDASYTTRVRRLRGLATGGRNAEFTLNSATILPDHERDSIFGDGNTDLFFAAIDEVVGRKTGEVLVSI